MEDSFQASLVMLNYKPLGDRSAALVQMQEREYEIPFYQGDSGKHAVVIVFLRHLYFERSFVLKSWFKIVGGVC